jgi:hypothetical protein
MIRDPGTLYVMNSAKHSWPWFRNDYLFHARSFLFIFESQNKHICVFCKTSWIWKGFICAGCHNLWMQIRKPKESHFQQSFSECWLQNNIIALKTFSLVTNPGSSSNIRMN